MRLTKLRAQNYRSIVDSGDVDIEMAVTVLIGKNEQGKTNFLKAIRSFNVDRKYYAADLPHHLRPDLERKTPSIIPVISCWLSLDANDKKKLKEIEGIESANEVKATKYFDNNYSFWLVTSGKEKDLKFNPPNISEPVEKIKAAATVLQAKLITHSERIPEFATNTEKFTQATSSIGNANIMDFTALDDILKTFSASIKSLPGQDQAIIDDIAVATNDFDQAKETIKSIIQLDPNATLKRFLPRFILHSTVADQIPNEVNLADFVKDSDVVSRGMANLCRAAGLTIQKIKDLASTTDNQEKESYEDYSKGTISGGLNEFWTQTEYNVHFRIDKDRLVVSISDSKYDKRIPPTDRSDGFQWYLSFYATLANDAGMQNETILLLDNPGLELHLDGQRDIKRYLEDKISPNAQVIYVTHSPAMVDPFNMRQVREVELMSDQMGTKVRKLVLKAGAATDLMEPVRAALGMSLVSSLLMNEWNILVEGVSDKPIIEGSYTAHHNNYKGKVMVNGSISETKDAFLALFYQKSGLPYVVLLDGDSGARELKKDLISQGIPEDRIITLNDVFPEVKTDFAIEDILSLSFYHEAVKKTYPSQLIDPPNATGKKRAKAYEELYKAKFQIQFSKRRVAETIKRMLQEGVEDKDSRDKIGILNDSITKKLIGQDKLDEKGE